MRYDSSRCGAVGLAIIVGCLIHEEWRPIDEGRCAVEGSIVPSLESKDAVDVCFFRVCIKLDL